MQSAPLLPLRAERYPVRERRQAATLPDPASAAALVSPVDEPPRLRAQLESPPRTTPAPGELASPDDGADDRVPDRHGEPEVARVRERQANAFAWIAGANELLDLPSPSRDDN